MINDLSIRVISSNEKNIQFDFFIDDIELDSMLGINRLTNIAFSNFDLDIFEVDAQRFPDYNRQLIVKQAIDAFLGIIPPSNQFGTERVVVYRCHCGSDYCGVISFQLRFDTAYVYWNDIRFEQEDEEVGLPVIARLQFERTAYKSVFSAFAGSYLFPM